MKKNTVTRIDKNPLLSVNPELERELPPLDADRYEDLKTMIRRDGVTDPVKYWHNPGTGLDEIIDGHHRHKIASELGVMYPTQMIDFTGRTITAVKYWMHVNQSGRRGGQRNLNRMRELQERLAIEKDERVTKTQIVAQVAEDAGVTARQVWRQSSGEKPKKKSPEETIAKLLMDLDRDALSRLVERIQQILLDG